MYSLKGALKKTVLHLQLKKLEIYLLSDFDKIKSWVSLKVKNIYIKKIVSGRCSVKKMLLVADRGMRLTCFLFIILEGLLSCFDSNRVKKLEVYFRLHETSLLL